MQDNNNPTNLSTISGLSEIASSYDAILSDIWGVVHNGIAAHPSAVEALSLFRSERGGHVVLVTNAPRPWKSVRDQLREFGVPDNAYDRIVTSGDVTRGLLKQRAGQRVYHLGPKRDIGIFEGIDLQFTNAEQADFVLCSGLFDDDHESPDDYADALAQMKAHNLDFLCANPDRVVERGDRLVYCAGALADVYETLGGNVVYAGKPYAPIYEAAFSLFRDTAGKDISKKQVLAIGDSIRTDVTGAVNAGLDIMFTIVGVHANDVHTSSDLKNLFGTVPAKPVAVQHILSW